MEKFTTKFVSTEVCMNKTMKNLIYYKYQNKEISTLTSEGYLTNFQKTNDWIEWLQKEFEISKEDFKKEQFNILFKNDTTQTEFMKLMYTNEEARKADWGMVWKDGEDKEFEGKICWPPIYLHPLMEDWLPSNCECGHITYFNIRDMKQDLKDKKNWNWKGEENDYQRWSNRTLLVRCKGCGKDGGIDRDCIYRVCEVHMGEGRKFWIKAWQKLGVVINNE